jgi:hypothetical protein
MRATIHNYFITVICVLLLLPFSLIFIPVSDRELNGVTEPVNKPVFTSQNWLTGDYQKKFESYFAFNLGLRKAAVRSASQIKYWLGVQRSEVIVGKDNELMGKECIDAFYGRDFLGEDSIHRVVTSIHRFQQQLNEHGVKFFMVIAPNKSRLYPDKIPDEFKGNANASTNYDLFRAQLKQARVPVVDFQQWFESIDQTSPHPLYSNLGVHWSYYSATFCGDSLLGYMANLLSKKVNRVKYKEISTTTVPYDTDGDMMKLLNLWFDIPVTRPLAYFKTELNRDSSKYIPSVLSIGDSYYWNIIYTGIPAAYFHPNSAYFYYHSTAYFNDGNILPVTKLNLHETVLSKDVVFFLYSEPNLRNLGNGIVKDFLQQSDSISLLKRQIP